VNGPVDNRLVPSSGCFWASIIGLVAWLLLISLIVLGLYVETP
jgi:hypothetical protein